jgi:hypothetical protein
MIDLTGRAFARAYRPGTAIALAVRWNPPRAPGSAGNRRHERPDAARVAPAPREYVVALVGLTLANLALVALCAFGSVR